MTEKEIIFLRRLDEYNEYVSRTIYMEKIEFYLSENNMKLMT